jgi:hypothetical protein
LNALSFLGPEEITKALLEAITRELLASPAAVATAVSQPSVLPKIETSAADLSLGSPSSRSAAAVSFGVAVIVGSTAAAVVAVLLRPNATGSGGSARGQMTSAVVVGLIAAGSAVLTTVAVKAYTGDEAEALQVDEGVGAVMTTTTSDPEGPDVGNHSQMDDIRTIKAAADRDGMLFARVNETWSTLKTFSLLSIRQHESASMHRLLQGLLRSLQSAEAQKRSIQCCLRAVSGLWKFDPADTFTWAKAGKDLEHILLIGRHVCSNGSALKFAVETRYAFGSAFTSTFTSTLT